MTLKDKTVSSPVGRAASAARSHYAAPAMGARLAIAAKTAEPHATPPGTIYSVAREIEQAGGQALPIVLDVRDDAAVAVAVEQTAQRFGGIDIIINNASAISLTGTLETSMKRFDLMFGVNVRGIYCTSQACLPYLKRAANPHILDLAPPLNLVPKGFKNHLAYTMAKYGMSFCTPGIFSAAGIGVNALWPKTTIATAACAPAISLSTKTYCGRLAWTISSATR